MNPAPHAMGSHDISEYLKYSRAVKGVSAYCQWNLLINQAYIPKGIDPYKYLDLYLTHAEIEEVLALSNRSKAQVDRIIGIVDEYKVCDDKLRNSVYKLFKINC